MKTTANKTAKLIECTTMLRLAYDPTSDKFKSALADFKDSIYKNATEESLLEQVAFYVLKYGSDRMIEGIGYISVNGEVKGEPFSGIDLESDDFTFDFEIGNDFPY